MIDFPKIPISDQLEELEKEKEEKLIEYETQKDNEIVHGDGSKIAKPNCVKGVSYTEKRINVAIDTFHRAEVVVKGIGRVFDWILSFKHKF